MLDRRASVDCESEAPKAVRCGFALRSSEFRCGQKWYAVAGANVVQQKIAVGMDDPPRAVSKFPVVVALERLKANRSVPEQWQNFIQLVTSELQKYSQRTVPYLLA